ncbi:DUF47 domain-containing protein [Elongatibacter sediminis]|uniref:DUF47 family protein n=1 Tax=Elongatibacter sediminis TaxID=3119006 RepID=A0AAW9RD81_9GAMM
MEIFKKEKRVRELVINHMSAVHDCLSETRGMLEDYVAGDTEASALKSQAVKRHEQEADRIKREARAVLHQGAFLPQIRADLNRLVEMVDGIADAGDTTARFIVDQSPHIPGEFVADLLDLFGSSVTCFHELRMALEDYVMPEGDIESLKEHVIRVGVIESEIDGRQAHLTRGIFDSDIDLALKLHLQQLVLLVARISDISEDVSDELESVVMGSVV